ncbi:MAG: helix-turn-helix domain-containing protein [Nitrososphaeria archaeon]
MEHISLHPLEKRLLKALLEKGGGSVEQLASTAGINNDQARRAIEWLRAKGLIKVEEKKERLLKLGENGKRALL